MVDMIVESVLSLIGNTPLVNLRHVTGENILAKAEYLNPGGSIKDRVALHMLSQAEARGDLRPGMTIMEPTSGNTGIGIALVGVQKGYRVVIVMPENMSSERKKIIRALGAELVLTPAEESIPGSVDEVNRRRAEDPNIYVPQQFENPDNPAAHYLSTGPEIWEQADGRVDAFVSGLGSGGTLQGCAQYLMERNPDIHIVAVEPEGVSALLGDEPGLHQIQGIGDGFVPAVLDVSIVNEVFTVTDDEAIETARVLARGQGVLVGTSAGANVWAAMQLAKELGPEARILTVLPDRVERYFSTALI
jgi:cysteine synthase A